MQAERHCNGCGIVKDSGEFYASSPRVCKVCVRAKVQAHREANIERIRAYDRSRGHHSRPEYAAEYQAKFPQRRAAHVAVGNAVRDGKITPWPICALPDCNGVPEAHHTHYDNALEVVWLCPVHHKQAHAMARKAA